MNKSIYKITIEALEIAKYLEDGEITPEIENSLIINQNELQNKALNFAHAIKSLEGDVSIIDDEIKRLRALKEAKTNAIERMKEAVVNSFQIYGITEVKSPTLKLSLRRSESVEVINQDQLPECFVKAKTTYTPDKVAIKDAIKSGLTVEGAVIVENFSLQIK